MSLIGQQIAAAFANLAAIGGAVSAVGIWMSQKDSGLAILGPSRSFFGSKSARQSSANFNLHSAFFAGMLFANQGMNMAGHGLNPFEYGCISVTAGPIPVLLAGTFTGVGLDMSGRTILAQLSSKRTYEWVAAIVGLVFTAAMHYILNHVLHSAILKYTHLHAFSAFKSRFLPVAANSATPLAALIGGISIVVTIFQGAYYCSKQHSFKQAVKALIGGMLFGAGVIVSSLPAGIGGEWIIPVPRSAVFLLFLFTCSRILHTVWPQDLPKSQQQHDPAQLEAVVTRSFVGSIFQGIGMCFFGICVESAIALTGSACGARLLALAWMGFAVVSALLHQTWNPLAPANTSGKND